MSGWRQPYSAMQARNNRCSDLEESECVMSRVRQRARGRIKERAKVEGKRVDVLIRKHSDETYKGTWKSYRQ